jgi:hypothetical protein
MSRGGVYWEAARRMSGIFGGGLDPALRLIAASSEIILRRTGVPMCAKFVIKHPIGNEL